MSNFETRSFHNCSTLEASGVDEPSLAQSVADALNYPGATPDDFRASYVFAHYNGHDEVKRLRVNETSITAQGRTSLPGALCDMPVYTLDIMTSAGERLHLQNRVAIIGYGVNASQSTLHEKFHGFAGDTDVCVLSGNLHNHAVVHSAFFGTNGTVPATLYPHEGTTTTVTLGFYDAQAASHIIATGTNYDAVLLKEPVHVGAIRVTQPLAYVSVWGALSDDLIGGTGHNPVGVAAVPARTRLRRVGSRQILHAAQLATGDGGDVDRFVRENILDDDTRFERIEKLQGAHKLCAAVQGRVAFPSSALSDRRARALLARYACV